MKKKNPYTTAVVTGSGRWSLFSSIKRNRKLLALAAVILIGVLGVLSFVYIQETAKSARLNNAVQQADKASSGFQSNDVGYSFKMLNEAVKLAEKDNCSEARAVYKTVKEKPNGIQSIDLQVYEKRIGDICSGTKPPAIQSTED